MHKHFAAFIFLTLFISVCVASRVYAVSADIVIAQVQAGSATGDLSATQEFISIYNNSSQNVDITNWCVTNKATILACFTTARPSITLQLSSHGYATVSSDSFALRNAYKPDVTYLTVNKTSGSIVSGSDTITLLDKDGQDVDSIGWATDVDLQTEGGIIWGSSLSGGSVLERQLDSMSGLLVDTDLPVDFKKITNLIVHSSSLEELETVIDVCPNIDGPQPVLLSDYEVNEQGDCYPDACNNVGGLQLVMPDGKDSDGQGGCVDHDECSNINGTQFMVPDGYKLDKDWGCILDLSPLLITELLPNTVGSDEGNEFIEIYNPNDKSVSLEYYELRVGQNFDKVFSFPAGVSIPAYSSAVFYNNTVKFSLLNSSSRVRITGLDSSIIDESGSYYEPKENTSWAIIENLWQYTNRPTPGEVNLAWYDEPVVEEVEDVDEIVTISSLKPCAPNQYRSLETNRCRLLVTTSSTLATCKDGQYRSEETNRCRSIASEVYALSPCSEGQERNPTTNRCRNVVAIATSVLKPCKDNQYRSEETNRCRNVVATSVPEAAFAVEPIADTSEAFMGWWALGGVGALAAGYGGWEWRREFILGARKFGSFFTSGK